MYYSCCLMSACAVLSVRNGTLFLPFNKIKNLCILNPFTVPDKLVYFSLSLIQIIGIWMENCTSPLCKPWLILLASHPPFLYVCTNRAAPKRSSAWGPIQANISGVPLEMTLSNMRSGPIQTFQFLGLTDYPAACLAICCLFRSLLETGLSICTQGQP